MPFIPHTPESLLPRSDSKNPLATCRGLTSTGRPCRRAIARPQAFSRLSTRNYSSDAYCWQHKDQATLSERDLPRSLQAATAKERTSIDTLIDRLGLMEVQEQDKHRKREKGPMLVGSRQSRSSMQPFQGHSTRRIKNSPRKPVHRSNHNNLSVFCCVGVADAKPVAPRRVRIAEKNGVSSSIPGPPTGQPMQELKSSQTNPQIPTTHPVPSSHRGPNAPSLRSSPPKRASVSRDPSLRTAEFLSLIPATSTPQATSLLLAELAKPVSVHDDEGYIYIFWLTPATTSSAQPSETALSLLSSPSSRPANHRRRTSEVLQSFSNSRSVPGSKNSKTILLKIGRASNVQRRLNEWSRQCGYNLSLIRYYPYNPTPDSHNIDVAVPTKVPHVHRIERLIHIELAAKRAMESGKCASCGSQHREWFEVEASREGIKCVDEVVRRWVDWGARNGA